MPRFAMPQAGVILVVEDEPVLRFILVEELQDAGYEVFAAVDAGHAIEILENNSDIQLLLTDIDLFAGGEGVELARMVRDRWPPVRIILTSGNWTLQQGELTYAERFIPKPHGPGVLLKTIKECLA
jgi:CheY-like chemotaxis protein